MKHTIWLILIIAAGIFAYNYFVHKPQSEEMKLVRQLENDFWADQKLFLQAKQSKQGSRNDNINHLRDIMHGIDMIKLNLLRLIPKLKEEAAIKKALWLEQTIKRFMRENGYK